MAKLQRGKRSSVREQQRSYAKYEAELRTCCQTHLSSPHAADCRRHQRGCGDKVAFPFREWAVERAKQYTAKERRVWSAYRCRSCRQWHIGHDSRLEEPAGE